MKSIKFYFDKGIIINECKRLYWVPMLYFFGLFIAIPLQILLEIQRYGPDLEENLQYLRITRNVLGFQHPGTLIMLFTVPVGVGLLLYRYLQDRKNSDMIHSLPLRRETLYISHGVTGILFLLLPLALITAITGIIHGIFDLEFIIPLENLWTWAGTIMLMSLVLYAGTIFVGMVTGMTIAQGVLTYIVLFLPVGLHQLIVYNMEFYLFGFSWERYGGLSTDLIQRLSPLIRIGMLSGEGLSSMEVLGYSIFVVGILGIGLWIYKHRRLENNLQVIVFKPLKQLFKYGVTFSVMLLAGMYFYSATDGSMQWVWLGYFFFALLGYAIAEAIIQKTVRILSKKMIRGFILYSGVIVVTMVILTLDVTGFEQRQPSIEEVEGIYIGHNDFSYVQVKNFGGVDTVFRQEENIAQAMDFHRMIIDYKEKVQNPEARSREDRPFHFVYELKNGETFTRHYPSVPKELYRPIYGRLVESEEYKYNHYPILSVAEEDVQRVTLRGYSNNSQVSLLEPEKIRGMIRALQEDILSADYDGLFNQDAWGGITFLLEEGKEIPFLYGPEPVSEFHTSWLKGFDHMEEWLIEEGLLEEARITGEQVAYMVVEPFDGRNQDFFYVEGSSEAEGEGSSEIRRFETRDEEKIEAALRLSSSGWRSGEAHGFKVGFYNDEGEQILLESFEKDRAPDFVQAFYN